MRLSQVFDFDRFSRNDVVGEVRVGMDELDLSSSLEIWGEITRNKKVSIADLFLNEGHSFGLLCPLIVICNFRGQRGFGLRINFARKYSEGFLMD
jgi:hypothetical protein